MSDIGMNISRKMKELGLSQNRLAKLSGISQSNISSILNATKSPSVDTIQLIAGALGCSLSELFGEVSAEGQPQLTDYERQLLLHARQMNRQGQEKLLDYARDLTENDRYTKGVPPTKMAE